MFTIDDAFYDVTEAERLATIVPPWLCDFSKSENVCKWTEDAWTTRANEMTPLWETGRENLLRYLGYYQKRGNQASPYVKGPNNPKVGINITRLLIEQRVAKTNKITPITQAIPANDDRRDKANTKVAQKLIEHYRHKYDYRTQRTRLLRRAFLDGESFIYVNWDKDIGGFEGKAKTVKVPGKNGEVVTVEKYQSKGDILVRPLRFDDVVVLLGNGIGGTFAYGCIIPVLRPVIELRAEFPDKAEEIRSSALRRFNYSTLEEEQVTDFVVDYHCYIRSMPFAPKGMHWRCTDKVLLTEVGDNPIPWNSSLDSSEFGNLPIERIVDVNVEGFFHGCSALTDINGLQNQYDKMTAFIMRSIWLFAHPKFIVPRGGVNIEQLSAGGGLVVQSSGPFEPYVATYNVVSPDVIRMWQEMPQLAAKLYGIFDHSLGQAPSGTRSASQLMIYDEQEEEGRETIKQKLEQVAVGIDAKVLSVASEHLGRDMIIQVLGENRMWHPETFSPKDLPKEVVVRIKVSSMLPENKYARVRTLIELASMFPGIRTNEAVVDMLEFGQHDKFINYAQLAVEAAEAENEKLLAGDEIDEPKLYEDLFQHWAVHAKMFQTSAFKKLKLSEQQAAMDHMLATEYLMFEQAHQNPMFKQKLLTLPDFPLFFVQELTPPAPPAAGGQESQQAQPAQQVEPQALVGQQAPNNTRG